MQTLLLHRSTSSSDWNYSGLVTVRLVGTQTGAGCELAFHGTNESQDNHISAMQEKPWGGGPWNKKMRYDVEVDVSFFATEIGRLRHYFQKVISLCQSGVTVPSPRLELHQKPSKSRK